MKKLTKRTKILVITILSVLALALGAGIALSLLSYEDPIDQAPETVPLGNYDYSKRAFLASRHNVAYKGEVYLIDPTQWLRRYPLSDTYDLRTCKIGEEPSAQLQFVCTDESHNHAGEDPTKTCLDYQMGAFLIDAYESAGESPIIYRARFSSIADVDDDVKWEGNTQIVRYDTGDLTGKTVVATFDSIQGFMTYDQWLFFMTVNADGVFSINVISKKGGDVTSLEVGKNGWTLMYVDDDHVYYQDTAGNIYRATLDLKNPEFIYYAESISALQSDYIGTFIHNGYLYFDADYETVPYSEGLSVDGSMVINFAKHSIRRVPLDNLYGESELVAENVLDNRVFGVGNNVLYYQPCIMADMTKDPEIKYYFNWTGGQLLGVNLDTLEPAEIVNDIGLDINGASSYVSGNVLFGLVFPIDGRFQKRGKYHGWGVAQCIVIPSTGAVSFFASLEVQVSP